MPLASADIPFAFQENTADFKSVTIQGQLTYRVADPKRLAGLLDFSINPQGAYRSEDFRKLPERLVHSVQTLMQAETQRFVLRDVLTSSGPLGKSVFAALQSSELVTQLGVEVLNLSLLSIRPRPEMAKALEAEAREALQRRSDEAIYARRNNAVEQERRIRESELNTEIAVEEKQRLVRETRMAADIAIEQQRATLMDTRIENERKETDSRAYALEETLKPVRNMNWKALMMLSQNGGDGKNVIALAFQEMASSARKIGVLNISPDLLQSLIAPAPVASLPSKGK